MDQEHIEQIYIYLAVDRVVGFPWVLVVEVRMVETDLGKGVDLTLDRMAALVQGVDTVVGMEEGTAVMMRLDLVEDKVVMVDLVLVEVLGQVEDIVVAACYGQKIQDIAAVVVVAKIGLG